MHEAPTENRLGELGSLYKYKYYYYYYYYYYILNVTQQCRCSPMLVFRAWATCGETKLDRLIYDAPDTPPCLPRARPFTLSPTTSKRLLRRLFDNQQC